MHDKNCKLGRKVVVGDCERLNDPKKHWPERVSGVVLGCNARLILRFSENRVRPEDRLEDSSVYVLEFENIFCANIRVEQNGCTVSGAVFVDEKDLVRIKKWLDDSFEDT